MNRETGRPSRGITPWRGELMGVCAIAVAGAVLGVVFVAKRLFFGRRLGWGGPRGCGGGRHRHGFGGRGPGRSFWLRAIFAKLDTTPGQEREIRAAVEDLQSSVRSAREGAAVLRQGVARAITGDFFDDGALSDASARLDETTGAIKAAAVAALRRVHGVLDPKQRERLAELLEKGFGRGPFGHPYRSA